MPSKPPAGQSCILYRKDDVTGSGLDFLGAALAELDNVVEAVAGAGFSRQWRRAAHLDRVPWAPTQAGQERKNAAADSSQHHVIFGTIWHRFW
jgi:hypothetical protein